MALELCSENCGVSSMSPRISFSHDFSQSDVIPVEQHPFGSNPSDVSSSSDFDFCVTESFELESFPADEFFSDGRILPTEVKRKKNAPLMPKGQSAPHPPLPPPCVNNHHNDSTSRNLKKESSKEGKYLNDGVYDKQSSKSFWSFNRSSSCGTGYRRSLCPLPLLSRSNSTGSTSPGVKRNSSSKEGPNNSKQNSQKHSSSTRSSSPSFGPNIYQKPPLNYKSHHGSYGNSVRVSPILNVHSANLFGLGSIFSNNRDKSKKK